MARVAVSSGRLQARRRRRRMLLGGALLLTVLALFGLCVWLSHAAFLRVTQVTVSGAASVASSSVEAYVRSKLEGSYGYVFARSNIFLYPRGAIASGLRIEYPAFRTVDVHAKDFHTVEVVVRERQPVALWCGDACWYLDETGLVYAPAPQFSETPYITYQGALAATTHPGLRQYLSPDAFQSLAALVAAIAAAVPEEKIVQVVVEENSDARMYFKNDFVLISSLRDGGGDVFERFELALQSSALAGGSLAELEYLDLRFGDRLYYKSK